MALGYDDDYDYLRDGPPPCEHDYEYWREGNRTVGKCRNCGNRIDATRSKGGQL